MIVELSVFTIHPLIVSHAFQLERDSAPRKGYHSALARTMGGNDLTPKMNRASASTTILGKQDLSKNAGVHVGLQN